MKINCKVFKRQEGQEDKDSFSLYSNMGVQPGLPSLLSFGMAVGWYT